MQDHFLGLLEGDQRRVVLREEEAMTAAEEEEVTTAEEVAEIVKMFKICVQISCLCLKNPAWLFFRDWRPDRILQLTTAGQPLKD
jgi:hypothetical protein